MKPRLFLLTVTYRSLRPSLTADWALLGSFRWLELSLTRSYLPVKRVERLEMRRRSEGRQHSSHLVVIVPDTNQ